MNFNLISPSSQGYDYTTRFREDIVIPANSKAYLNFAQFTKQNAVNLTEDQEISISSNDLYPKYNPTTFNENKIDPTTAKETIKAGIYDFARFQSTLNKALETIRDLPTQQLYYYSSDIPIADVTERTRISMGYYLAAGKGEFKVDDFVIDATDVKDFGVTGENKLTKTSVTAGTPLYDAYAGSSIHYWHLAVPCEETTRNNNLIMLETSDDMFALQGSVCAFLYSPEYTNIKGGGANQIGGTNLPIIPTSGNVTNRTPKSYLTFEIKKSGAGSYLRIFQARTNTGTNDPVLNTFDFDTNYVSKIRVANIPLAPIFGTLDTQAKLAIQLYTPVNTDFTGNDVRVYYRVYVYDHANATEEALGLIFDSITKNSYFNYGFFNTYAPPDSADKANSGIPFKIGVAAQREGEGFEKCLFTGFDKSADTAASTRAIVNTYTIQVTPQLAKYLDTDGTLGPLFPNVCDTMQMNRANLYVDLQLSLDYMNDSYSVMIEELPISSWKNKQDLADGGYSQAIIANIPSPFVDAFSQTNKDDNFLSCNYEPNFQSPNIMKNQAIRTNQLRVKVINLRTDRPAEEISQSIINFTIESPEMGKIEEV